MCHAPGIVKKFKRKILFITDNPIRLPIRLNKHQQQSCDRNATEAIQTAVQNNQQLNCIFMSSLLIDAGSMLIEFCQLRRPQEGMNYFLILDEHAQRKNRKKLKNEPLNRDEDNTYPSTATTHLLLGTRRRKEAFSRIDSARALNCHTQYRTIRVKKPTVKYA